jgi:hypothetical protein
MNSIMNDEIIEISKIYKETKDLNEAFSSILSLFETYKINDYSLYSSFFDYEPKISYLLFKKSYKIIVNDSYEDIKEAEKNNDSSLNGLKRLSAMLFGTLVFSTEELFLSQAAKDAFKEVWGNEFLELELDAFKQKRKIIESMIQQKPSDKERYVNYLIAESENSIYNKELNTIAKDIKLNKSK